MHVGGEMGVSVPDMRQLCPNVVIDEGIVFMAVKPSNATKQFVRFYYK